MTFVTGVNGGTGGVTRLDIDLGKAMNAIARQLGVAYVVEMRDYPYTDKGSDKPFVERTKDEPLGRIRLVEDTDGDGRFDKSTIFAEGLSWPTGLALRQPR